MKVRDRLDQIRGVLDRCGALKSEPVLIAYFVKLEHEIVDLCDEAERAERSACAYDLGLNRIDISPETRNALQSAEERMMRRGRVEVKT